MAQAILLQDVESLGERGHVVDVAPGYLRNYLVPRKLAQPATEGALQEARRRMEAAERVAKARAEREAEAAGLLSKTVLTIHQRAGEDGKLFGSVGTREIPGRIRCPLLSMKSRKSCLSSLVVRIAVPGTEWRSV